MMQSTSRVLVVALALMFLSLPETWATRFLAFMEAEFDGGGGVDGLGAAQSVAVSPDGRHVYVASLSDNAVAVFSRDAGTGELTFVEAELDGRSGVDGLDGARAVAVSPDGAHVYVAAGDDDAVAVFRRRAETGELTFVEAEFDGVGGVDGLDTAQSVAVSPDGGHVYVAALGDSAVAVFARDVATGSLTFVEAEFDGVGDVDGLEQATAVAVSPDGGHVYAAAKMDSAVAVFERDAVTGELVFVEAEFDGTDGVDGLRYAESVAMSPDGAHVYVAASLDDAVAVFERDAFTGRLTFVEALLDGVGGVNGLYGARAVAVSPDGGHVYVAGKYDHAVAAFERDGFTGRLTFVEAEFDGVGGVDGLWVATSVVVSPDGGHVYAASWNDSAVAVFERVAGTGELEFVEAELDGDGGSNGLAWPQSVAVSPDGGHVYVAAEEDDAVAVFKRDTNTGELTYVEAVFDGVDDVDGLRGAGSVAVSPDGRHVYVAARVEDAVAVFERDAGTGQLGFVEAEFDGVDGVDGLGGWDQQLVVSPDGGHVYVTSGFDDAVVVFERAADTGQLTFVEAVFDGVGGVDGLNGATSVALSSDGRHMYVASGADGGAVAVFDRDVSTGALAFVEAQFYHVGDVIGLEDPEGVAVSPDGGHVYVACSESDSVVVFSRDVATGALTFVGAEFDRVVDGLDGARSVAISPDGGHVFVASYEDDALAVFERNTSSGELTFVEAEFDGVLAVDGLGGASSVAVSPDGAHVYVAAASDDAVAVFWKDFPVAHQAGNEAYFGHDYAAAEQHFSDLISTDDRSAVAYNNRGLARCKQRDFAGARADFDVAKSLDPTYVAPYVNQGKCLAVQRELAAARTELEAGLAIDPDHVKLLYNLGWIEAEQGRYDEAVARYDAAQAKDGTYIRAPVARGVALAKKGEAGAAVDALYEAINRALPGDLFAAMAAYNLQLLRGPGVSMGRDAAWKYLDGLFHMRVGLFEQAEEDFVAALALEPAVPDIPWMLAWSRLLQLRWDDAGVALADAQASMPELEVLSSADSQLFIDGLFRGNTPQTVQVFPSRFDLAFRRGAGPQERTVVAYADDTPGGSSPIDVTLTDVSSLSPFAAVADSDRDWLGDGWELSAFGHLAQAPGGDADGDGITNLFEYWEDTDPGSGCVGDPAAGDADGDGVCDDADVCAGFSDTEDADLDGVPDGCDRCQGDDASGDGDRDGLCDDLDCDSSLNLCLHGERFRIGVEWRDFDADTGRGEAFTLSEESGYFTFFNPNNAEVFIKILNTCVWAGSYWVFDTHLSNTEYTITVTDTQTGQTRTIFNPLDYSPPSILGTSTVFTECGSGDGSDLPRSELIDTSTLPPNETPVIEEYQDPGVIGTCTQDANTICLNDGRFRVHATYQDFEGDGGAAKMWSLTSDSGYATFFNDSNVELFLKVLDACALNGKYWVFVGGLTNVLVDLYVEDTQTGKVWHETNSLGRSFATTLDTGTFFTECP